MRLRWWAVAPVLLIFGMVAWRYFFPLPPQLQLRGEAQIQPEGLTVVVAPHEDDEALSAAGLIQETLRRHGRVHVVLVTNGDGFRLAAERWLGRLRLSPGDMIAFGRHRQGETLAALRVLGLGPGDVTFLGYPDAGIASLWLDHWKQPYRSPYTGADASPYRLMPRPYTARALLDDLTILLRERRPAVVVYPHPLDAHPDHWAVHNFTVAVLEDLRRQEPGWVAPREMLYLTHRGDWPAPKGLQPNAELLPPGPLATGTTVWARWPLSPGQVRRKEEAVRLYQSQMALMQRYLLSFVRTTELFGTLPRVTLESGSVWTLVESDAAGDTLSREMVPAADALGVDGARDGETLKLHLRLRSAPLPRYLYALTVRTYRAGTGWDEGFRVEWRPGEGAPAAPPGATTEAVGQAVEFRIPLALLQRPEAVMVGFETRLGGVQIDRVGWRLISLEERERVSTWRSEVPERPTCPEWQRCSTPRFLTRWPTSGGKGARPRPI